MNCYIMNAYAFKGPDDFGDDEFYEFKLVKSNNKRLDMQVKILLTSNF